MSHFANGRAVLWCFSSLTPIKRGQRKSQIKRNNFVRVMKQQQQQQQTPKQIANTPCGQINFLNSSNTTSYTYFSLAKNTVGQIRQVQIPEPLLSWVELRQLAAWFLQHSSGPGSQCAVCLSSILPCSKKQVVGLYHLVPRQWGHCLHLPKGHWRVDNQRVGRSGF